MTIVAFVPPPITPFQFLATLDGNSYTVIVKWNITAQRWYVDVDGQDGVRILTIPLIGSPPDYGISLVAGYFTSTLVFRQDTQTFEILP